MPIVPSEDASATAILEAAVSERVTDSAFATSKLRQADIGNLGHSTLHRVEVLPLGSIRSGTSLRDAKRLDLGWRFLIHAASGTIAAATVIKKGDKYEFAGFSEGELVTATDAAIHFAEGRDEIRNGRFEPILLQIPELHIAVLWLKDLDGGSDYIVRQAGQLMTSAQFSEYLLDLAKVTRRKRG
jgi:hypothetical protein